MRSERDDDGAAVVRVDEDRETCARWMVLPSAGATDATEDGAERLREIPPETERAGGSSRRGPAYLDECDAVMSVAKKY